uniref:Mitochondrial fission factor n=1 Tax=Eptatretus burgeri TaxID=7764 RepID=A0A8C4R1C4_EPTBU
MESTSFPQGKDDAGLNYDAAIASDLAFTAAISQVMRVPSCLTVATEAGGQCGSEDLPFTAMDGMPINTDDGASCIVMQVPNRIVVAGSADESSLPLSPYSSVPPPVSLRSPPRTLTVAGPQCHYMDLGGNEGSDGIGELDAKYTEDFKKSSQPGTTYVPRSSPRRHSTPASRPIRPRGPAQPPVALQGGNATEDQSLLASAQASASRVYQHMTQTLGLYAQRALPPSAQPLLASLTSTRPTEAIDINAEPSTEVQEVDLETIIRQVNLT